MGQDPGGPPLRRKAIIMAASHSAAGQPRSAKTSRMSSVEPDSAVAKRLGFTGLAPDFQPRNRQRRAGAEGDAAVLVPGLAGVAPCRTIRRTARPTTPAGPKPFQQSSTRFFFLSRSKPRRPPGAPAFQKRTAMPSPPLKARLPPPPTA